jgi:hypothetical protein
MSSAFFYKIPFLPAYLYTNDKREYMYFNVRIKSIYVHFLCQ